MYQKYKASFYKKKLIPMNQKNLQKNNLHQSKNFYSFSNTNLSDLSRSNNFSGGYSLLNAKRQPAPVLPISAYTRQN